MFAFLSPEPVSVTFCGKWVFAGIIKGVKMRSSWINWMGLWIIDKSPYNGQKRRRHRHGGEGRVKTEAQVGVKQLQAKEPGATRTRRGREGPPPRALAGSMALLSP